MAGFSFAAHPAAFAIAVSFRAEAIAATSFRALQNLSRHYKDAGDLSARLSWTTVTGRSRISLHQRSVCVFIAAADGPDLSPVHASIRAGKEFIAIHVLDSCAVRIHNSQGIERIPD